MKTATGWFFLGACTLRLMMIGISLTQAKADVVMITTRMQTDTAYGPDRFEGKGPGMTSPGDVAMGILLGNHGYSSRLIIDSLLASTNPANERNSLLYPGDPELKIGLVIISGSSASANIPEPPVGIPVMMGEHVTLGNNSTRPGSLYMYQGVASSDPDQTQGATKFMKVLNPNHPILQGIPLDQAGCVKIFRDAYPRENQNVPPAGFANYEYRWCTQATAAAASGTLVLGALATDTSRSCLAVVESGGALANGSAASARLVHMFVNENGSNGSRRAFLALTHLGQVIFLRAAQWAMGETLTPYDSIGVADLQPAGSRKVSLSWHGSLDFNYSIQTSTDLTNWQTIVEDIAGIEGTLSRTVSFAPAVEKAFLRLERKP